MFALILPFSKSFAQTGAAEKGDQVNPTRVKKSLTVVDTRAPSMAFLEYLADLEEVDGKLVGAIDMAGSQNSQQSAGSTPANTKQSSNRSSTSQNSIHNTETEEGKNGS